MIDLTLFSIHWHLLLGLVIGANIGLMIFGLVSNSGRTKLKMQLASGRKRIDEQAEIIFKMRKELIEAKGAASSEEFRADALQKMKNELQESYNQLEKDYSELVQDYKKLYIQLDALKASEARKFRDPKEIIEQMITNYQSNILLDSDDEPIACDNCEGTGEVIARERIHSRIIDIPYKKCLECNGTGIK